MRLKKYEQEIDRLHGVESSLKSQNISINNDLTEKSLKLSQVEKESEDRRIKQEETFMYLQMQLNALKTKSEALDSELKKSHEQNSVLQNSLNNTDVNSKLYKEEISLLQNRINKDEVEISNLKSQLSELNKQLNLVTLMRSETENLLLAIKKDYNKVSENYGESVNKLKNLEAENDSLLRRLSETHDMSQELTKLKSELDDQNSLITRLRQESLQNERNHAMKTAMLATAEVHIENLKKELSIRDETTKESLERVSLLQIRLSSAESRLQERVLELTTIIDESQKKLEELQKVHETEMTDLKEKFESQIESIQRENAKKSSTARVILSEKEEEIRVLQEKIKELQTEISSGGPNERRIFELASVQARRDAVHGLHRY
jgi:chromosome segregation ATPase